MLLIFSILIVLSHYVFGVVLGTIIQTKEQINKPKNPSLPYLACRRREGQFMKQCESCVYRSERVQRASTERGYTGCTQAWGGFPEKNDLHAGFMEAEPPPGLKSTKNLSVAEA